MHHEQNLVEVGRQLKEKGFRLTPQRLMILEAVMAGQGHVSVERIHAQVADQYADISPSTIYRTLETFRELGVVTQTDLGSGRIEYHFAARAGHHHLVCRRCGGVAELDQQLMEPIATTLLHQYGFRAELSHVAFFGVCARCGRGNGEG